MQFLLIFHIIVASCSAIMATYALFAPTKAKLQTVYALVALAIASGLIQIIIRPELFMDVRTQAAIYTGLMLTALLVIHYRLVGLRHKLKSPEDSHQD